MSVFNTVDYVEYASQYILENGYISKSRTIRDNVNIVPTTDVINKEFKSGKRGESSDLSSYVFDDFFLSLKEKKELNNFESKVIELLSSKEFDEKFAGFVTAFVNSAKSMMNMKEKTKDFASSKFVGEIGQKVKGVALVLSCSDFQSRFGEGTRILMQSEKGNVYVWFSSSRKRFDIGEKYNVVAYVKDHNEFKGTKQTILTRCQLDKVEAVEEIL